MSLTSLMVGLLPMAIKAVEEKESRPSELELELEALKVENAALKEDNSGLQIAIHERDIENLRLRQMIWERARNPPPVNPLPLQPSSEFTLDQNAMRQSLERFCTCVPGRADMFRRAAMQYVRDVPDRPVSQWGTRHDPLVSYVSTGIAAGTLLKPGTPD